MIVAYIEAFEGKIKKTSQEVLTYGFKLAQAMNTSLTAITFDHIENGNDAGEYGASKLLKVEDPRLAHFDSKAYTKVIAQLFDSLGGVVMIVPFNQNGRGITPRLSIRLNAGLVNGANALPDVSNGFTVTKSVYSGKAIANYKINTDKKVIGLASNSIEAQKNPTACTIEKAQFTLEDSDIATKYLSSQIVSGEIPLSEAEIVVSGGRGLKGPENWGMIEECAKILGGATACSRPVADMHWRPHYEHVGQTGLAISPNLYIAVGISGAIQHLAGVNNSKVIVVINSDPEAPFFKAATYGIVGDLFEVMPKFNEALKKLKSQENS